MTLMSPHGVMHFCPGSGQMIHTASLWRMLVDMLDLADPLTFQWEKSPDDLRAVTTRGSAIYTSGGTSLRKYDTDGTLVWSVDEQLPSEAELWYPSDIDGEVAECGPSSPDNLYCVWKRDSSGAVEWATQLSDLWTPHENDAGWRVVHGTDGRIYVVGAQGVEPAAPHFHPVWHGVFSIFASDGTLEFSRFVTGGVYVTGLDLDVDPTTGNIAVAASQSEYTVPPARRNCGLLYVMDSDGNYLWWKVGSNTTSPVHVRYDSNGDLYTVGLALGASKFRGSDGTPLASLLTTTGTVTRMEFDSNDVLWYLADGTFSQDGLAGDQWLGFCDVTTGDTGGSTWPRNSQVFNDIDDGPYLRDLAFEASDALLLCGLETPERN